MSSSIPPERNLQEHNTVVFETRVMHLNMGIWENKKDLMATKTAAWFGLEARETSLSGASEMVLEELSQPVTRKLWVARQLS